MLIGCLWTLMWSERPKQGEKRMGVMCVRVRVRVCARACVRGCGCVCVGVGGSRLTLVFKKLE